MAGFEQSDADQLAFWNGPGGPHLGGAAGAHRHHLGAGVGGVAGPRRATRPAGPVSAAG